ncbi:solute carrier family 13 member 2-like [Aplysia californica]|uniref:Solute carrier family 13 member 2-like n=1 Tax=Aplysia californica TaxID=6500 RepID=A0ABM1A518_APLCA|nr:solute carrier family 13 member 2-like [Aplysia californica]
MMSWLRDLALIWRTLVIVVVPLAALPVLLTDGSKEMSCLYGVILVAVFWMTEVMPLPVTALCPVVIFSLLGVLPARQIAPNYVKDASIFSLSCLTFALCVEKWNLHRRIALNTMLLMGSSPKWLLLGFMLPTWFLSMWVNNTSATAMMIPIVMAVLQELRLIQSKARGVDTNGYHDRDERGEDAAVEQHQTPGPEVKTTKNMAHTSKMAAVTSSTICSMFNMSDRSEESIEYPSDDFRNLCKSLSICICYSASIGGSGSLTGTSTNLVMQGQAEEIFGSYGLPSEINFLNWLIIALPVSMICLLITWIWLLVHFFGFK